MRTFNVMLTSINQVKDFVNDMSRIEGETFLYSGRYIIDAKSIMGIFSLDLSKPLKLEIEQWKEEYEAFMEKYLE